ncbi:hypothetical protein [Chondrinema litorale]|uniref:hypothetical protein n=1 Tax=Chondrinema litorale TaxID=2994555 RepID=UPI002543A012|nr:hypothetical protein [Chondrinema litorale]UZR95223.1 hypothetical protein OQ292_05245 [Chondrinema litorale]
MQVKILLIFIFFVFATLKTYSQDISIEINGVFDDTLKLVDETQPLKIKIENSKDIEVKSFRIIHAKVSIENAVTIKRTVSDIKFLQTEVEVNLPKIQKNDILYFLIDYTQQTQPDIITFEVQKVVGETKISASKPYYLEVNVFDNETQIRNSEKYISIVKNWKTKEATQYHIQTTEGTPFTENIKANRYYFLQIPDSLKLEFYYDELAIHETFELPTSLLKYGGVIHIGIVRDTEMMLEKYQDILNDTSTSVEYKSILGSILKTKTVFESFIFISYQRFPVENSECLSHSSYLPLTKKQKKGK